jgi:cation diffusion facilitator family transporter
MRRGAGHIDLTDWQHGHSFGQEMKRPGERRTLAVIAITATMMVVEIVAGLVFASMALLADGLHMASHTVALGITAFAYIYARRHAYDPAYSFGTGKVNALGGFTGAVLLAAFALLMAAGSVDRLIHPARISIDYAILVAAVGLAVNGVCVAILNADDHGRDHAGGGDHVGEHAHGHQHQDHNLRAAYLHVLADALTSVLAILALLSAKYLGFTWMDPVMGVVGAVLVARWSVGLMRSSSAVLLDRRGPRRMRDRMIACLEADGDSHVADIHLWSIGPGVYAAEVSVVACSPCSVDDYKSRLPQDLGLEHVTIETHQCPTPPAEPDPAARGASA